MRRDLRAAPNAVAASEVIRATGVADCGQFFRLLHAMDAAALAPRFGAASFRGLIEESIRAATRSCDKSALVQRMGRENKGEAGALALSLLTEDSEQALRAARAHRTPALLRREAELLAQVNAGKEARSVLMESLALEDEPELRARLARLSVAAGEAEAALALSSKGDSLELRKQRAAALASLGRNAELADLCAHSALFERAEIAAYAVQHAAAPEILATLDGLEPALLIALAEKLEGQRADLLSRAAALAPEDADLHIALARALELAGKAEDAIAAWDRAARIAPAVEAAQLTPIRLLRESGREHEGLQRAATIAEGSGPTALQLGSLAYKYAGDPQSALRLARAASAARPEDGRLQAELASRLVEADRGAEAAGLLIELLVCGANGRPWHRHEIAARAAQLVSAAQLKARITSLSCAVVAPEDLAEVLAALSRD